MAQVGVEIRRSQFEARTGKEVTRLKKTHHRKGLVEWLKVKTLSSKTPVSQKNKNR
jgi:hypothetical protein